MVIFVFLILLVSFNIHYKTKKIFLFNLDSPSTPQLPTVKDTIQQFHLDKCQLAFTIGKRRIMNDIVTFIAFACTTVYSEELIEIVKESEPNNPTTVSMTGRSHTLINAGCRMYKYAPRSGYTDSNDEILIFFTSKLKPNKYGG
jgi:hypothetical protein